MATTPLVVDGSCLLERIRIEMNVGVDQRFVPSDARLVHLDELLRGEQPGSERVLQLIDGGLHQLHLTAWTIGRFLRGDG